MVPTPEVVSILLTAFDKLRELEVFKNLIQCGTILETVFDLDSAGTLDEEPTNGLMLEVLYATVLEPDLIGQVVEVPPERVRLIEKNGESKPLGGPAVDPAAKPKHKTVPKKPKLETVTPDPEVVAAAVPPPPPAAAPAETPAKTVAAAPVTAAETTIRLNVSLLDSLMTLAGELIRIPYAQIAQRKDRVGDAEVLNLRDRMVPLVYLADALGLPRPAAAQRALNVVLVDIPAPSNTAWWWRICTTPSRS
jgi:two-component system chemotaxis sensor kinase CheA